VAGVLCILGGLLAAAVGVALAANVGGVGERAATFGGAITFLFDGGETLRHRQRAYRAWGAVLFVGGLVIVAVGVAVLS